MRYFLDFRFKPLHLSVLFYMLGFMDIKKHFFGKKATFGYFFMAVGLMILLSFLSRIRTGRNPKNINEYIHSEEMRMFAAFALILLPLFTLWFWFINYK